MPPANVLDLDAPPPRRLPSIPLIDRVTGGGVVAGSRVLLTGDSNAGKTTLALCMADAWTAAGFAPWFLSLEMGPELLQAYVRRLRLMHGFGYGFAPWGFPAFVQSQKPIGHGHVVRRRHPILIVDSLQALPDKPAVALHALFRLAADNGASLLVIGQATKAGSFRGPSTLMHDVDLHIHVSTPRERWANGQARFVRVLKNRHGPNAEIETRLTETGHVLAERPAIVMPARHGPPIPLWGWGLIGLVSLFECVYWCVK